MALSSINGRLLKDTQNLVSDYNTNLEFKKRFDEQIKRPKAFYRGRPLNLYARIIATLIPKYNQFYQEILGSTEKFPQLLVSFYKDQASLLQFNQITKETILGTLNPVIVTPDEVLLIDRLDNTPEGPKKEEIFNQLDQHLSTQTTSIPLVKVGPKVVVTPVTNIKARLSQIQTPSFVKSFISQGQIQTRKILIKIGPSIISGAVGGAAGLTFGPTGGFLGAATGAVLPSAIKSKTLRTALGGGGKALLGTGLKGLGFLSGVGTGGLSTAAALILGTKTGRKLTKWLIAGSIATIAVILLLIPGGLDLLGTIALLPPDEIVGGSTPTPVKTIASCPVPRGKISCGSFGSDPSINSACFSDRDEGRGHCGEDYGQSYASCCMQNGVPRGRRAKSIDVYSSTGDKNVYLPTIDNRQDIKWRFADNISPGADEEGRGFMFETIIDGVPWTMHLFHMGSAAISLSSDYVYPPGTLIGQYSTTHVHITLGKNISYSSPDLYDCSPNWLPADFMCQ